MGLLQSDDEVKEDLIAIYGQLYYVRRWSQTFFSKRKERGKTKVNSSKIMEKILTIEVVNNRAGCLQELASPLLQIF